tara:strand:+ start:3704 stop:4486 length:783 start_codon:yes stop_codon:yes gene_type:complete
MLSNKKSITKTAVILCGGKGTRLGDIGKKIPKSLVRINKKPIIWYILKSLKMNGFNQFILPIGYKGLMIRTYLKNNIEFKDYNIQVVKTGINSSIANRIFQIKKNILSTNFLLLNGDAIFDFNLNKIYNDHIKLKNKMTLVGCENELPYGTVGIINNKIISFNRNIIFDSVNIKNKKNFKAFIYSGMSVMNINILNRNYKKLVNFEKSLYPLFIKKFKCNFVPMKGFWHSVDNEKDISSLNEKSNKIKFNKLKKITKKFK